MLPKEICLLQKICLIFWVFIIKTFCIKNAHPASRQRHGHDHGIYSLHKQATKQQFFHYHILSTFISSPVLKPYSFNQLKFSDQNLDIRGERIVFSGPNTNTNTNIIRVHKNDPDNDERMLCTVCTEAYPSFFFASFPSLFPRWHFPFSSLAFSLFPRWNFFFSSFAFCHTFFFFLCHSSVL